MSSIDATRSRLVDDAIADAGGAPSSVLATKARLHGLSALGVDAGVELASLFDTGTMPEMKARRVRTASGAARYGQPIGSIIVRDPTARGGGKRGSGGGKGGAGRELRQAPTRGGESTSRGGSRGNGGGRSSGGRRRRGRGGGGGSGGGGGDQILEGLGGLAGLAALMGGLFGDGKKPRKGRKPRNPRGRQGRGGVSPDGGSGNGGSPSTRRSPGGGASGGDGRNLRNGGGDPFGYRNPVDRGRRDTIGKSLPSVEATREAWERGLP